MSTTTCWTCRHCGCAVLSGTDCPTGGEHETAEVGRATERMTALRIALDAAVATARAPS